MNKILKKRAVLAVSTISVAVVLMIMIAYPAYAASEQTDYLYALNQENWAVEEEYTDNLDAVFSNVHTITIDAKGYAFLRLDEETIKQYNAETNLLIQFEPATEANERNVDVTGFVKVNEITYTIESGKVIIRTDKNLLFIRCQGLDEDGDQFNLRMRIRYFWWGGKLYAIRSIALLQTVESPMLLLQRGIARIQ